jgi:hypothetical protein
MALFDGKTFEGFDGKKIVGEFFSRQEGFTTESALPSTKALNTV